MVRKEVDWDRIGYKFSVEVTVDQYLPKRIIVIKKGEGWFAPHPFKGYGSIFLGP